MLEGSERSKVFFASPCILVSSSVGEWEFKCIRYLADRGIDWRARGTMVSVGRGGALRSGGLRTVVSSLRTPFRESLSWA